MECDSSKGGEVDYRLTAILYDEGKGKAVGMGCKWNY